MLEREKQVTDQEKKAARAKADHEHSHKDAKDKTEQKHAGMATDPKAMENKQYVEQITEKTEKH